MPPMDSLDELDGGSGARKAVDRGSSSGDPFPPSHSVDDGSRGGGGSGPASPAGTGVVPIIAPSLSRIRKANGVGANMRKSAGSFSHSFNNLSASLTASSTKGALVSPQVSAAVLALEQSASLLEATTTSHGGLHSSSSDSDYSYEEHDVVLARLAKRDAEFSSVFLTKLKELSYGELPDSLPPMTSLAEFDWGDPKVDSKVRDAYCHALIVIGDLEAFSKFVHSTSTVVFSSPVGGLDNGTDDFMHALGTASKLKEIVIKDFLVPWYAMVELCQVLAMNPFVKTVRFINVSVTNFPAAMVTKSKAFLENATHVTALECRKCRNFQQMADVLSFWVGTGGKSSVTNLVMDDCELAEKECQVLARALSTNASLEFISLANNHIYLATTVNNLRKALSSHSKLSEIPLATVVDGRKTETLSVAARAGLYLAYFFLGTIYQLCGLFTCILSVGLVSLKPVEFSDVVYVDLRDTKMRPYVYGSVGAFTTLAFLPLIKLAAFGQQSYEVDAGFYVSYFILVTCVLGLITWIAFRDRAQVFLTVENPSTSVRLNLNNLRRLLGMNGSFIQLAFIGILASDWDFFGFSFEFLSTMTDFERGFISFCQVCQIVWWLLSVYIGTNLARGYVVDPLINVPFINTTMQFLGSFMFIPILSSMMRIIQCDHSTVPPTWTFGNSECGSLSHVAGGSFVSFTLVSYLVSASVIGLQFIEDHSPLNDIRIVEIYSLGERIFKLLLTTSYYFLYRHQWITLGVLFVYSATFFIISIATNPCKDIRWVNNLRSTWYGVLALTTVFNFVPYFVPSTSLIYRVSIYVALGPVGLVLVIFGVSQCIVLYSIDENEVYEVSEIGSVDSFMEEMNEQAYQRRKSVAPSSARDSAR